MKQQLQTDAMQTSALSRYLAGKSHILVGVYALSAAFVTYFCMYAFRKPFSVATYDFLPGWDWDLSFKIAIVISQALGYTISKYIGIRIVSEASPTVRPRMIFCLISMSFVALIAFAIVPPGWKILAIFCNGLPLGMIWGLVFGYVEGRRISELLGTGLCISFIVSSGVVKSIGRMLIVDFHVPELWMPAATALMFYPLLVLSVWLLSLTPPPDARDRAERKPRVPMFREQRIAFIRATGPALLFLIITYVVLSSLRDFRDNFAIEIWTALGYANAPEIFSLTELPVSLIVLLMFGLTFWVRNNKNAVLLYHWMIIAGAALIAAATYAWQMGLINPVLWRICVGVGTYIGYVPFNAVLIDRLTAALDVPANAAFFMLLADACGYTGSILLMLFRDFGELHVSWLHFFSGLCYASAAVIAVATLASYAYFRLRGFGPAEAVEMRRSDVLSDNV